MGQWCVATLVDYPKKISGRQIQEFDLCTRPPIPQQPLLATGLFTPLAYLLHWPIYSTVAHPMISDIGLSRITCNCAVPWLLNITHYLGNMRMGNISFVLWSAYCAPSKESSMLNCFGQSFMHR